MLFRRDRRDTRVDSRTFPPGTNQPPTQLVGPPDDERKREDDDQLMAAEAGRSEDGMEDRDIDDGEGKGELEGYADE